MQWLQPVSFFWAALLIPGIVFLYLLKRRYTDRTVSSTLLWRRVMREMEVTRPWERLRRHLLLFLQLLAAVLLMTALARPAVPTAGVGADHTVILLDTSGSMLTREKEADRLTLAKGETIKLADSLQGEQTMTVVQAGAPPRVVVAETRDSRLVKERVNQLSANVEPVDPGQSLSLARALASRADHSEVILISDGSRWEIAPQLAPDRYIHVGRNGNNLSLAQVSTVRKGERVEGFVRLENTGPETMSTTLSLYDAEDRLLDTRAVEVAASDSVLVMWDELPISAFYRVQLKTAQDALPADDERWTVPKTSYTYEVFYAGEGNAFLEKALRLINRVEIVEETDRHKSESLLLADYPLYVLNGIGSELPRNGNGLFIHPSPHFAGWNWGDEQQPQAVIEQIDHPILKHVSLEDMYVAQARALETPPGWQTVVRSGDLPLIVTAEKEGQRFVVFTFDLQQSDLPLRPEFPVLMHQIVNWLMPEERVQLSEGRLHEPTVIPVPGESDLVTVTDPSGETTELVPEQLNAVYTPPEPGLYEVRAKGAESAQYFTVPFPEEETDIAPQPNLPTLQAVDNSESEENSGAGSTREIGYWFSLAVLLLLAVEWVVFARGY